MKRLISTKAATQWREGGFALNQSQPLEAGVPFLIDDNVIVYGDAKRPGDLDDRLRYLDIGARRRRVARGMIVHQNQRGG